MKSESGVSLAMASQPLKTNQGDQKWLAMLLFGLLARPGAIHCSQIAVV